MEAAWNEIGSLISRSSTPLGLAGSSSVELDKLARESDVTVSTNTTSYAEYKGFFIYVSSAIVFIVFVLWAVVPEMVLLEMGISYYPDKYWSHAIPTYLLLLMLFTYVFVGLYNTEVKTQKLDSLNNFIDRHTVYPDNPAEYIWKAPSGVWDLPIGLVNDVLYDPEFVELALADLWAEENVDSLDTRLVSPKFVKKDMVSSLVLNPEAIEDSRDKDLLQLVWDELLNGHREFNEVEMRGMKNC